MDKSYKYFLEIVESGSLSAAARKLRVSQPALSLSIKELEAELKAELFVRSRRGVQLTKLGKEIYKKALDMQTAEKNLLSVVEANNKIESAIAIGAVDSIALSLVSEIDVEQANSKLTVDNSSTLADMVEAGKLDVAYIVKPKTERSSLIYKSIGNEVLHAVATKQPKSNIVRLLAYNANSTSYMHIHNSLISAGLQPDPIFHSTDPHLLTEAAAQNKGVAVIPKTLHEKTKHSKLVRVYKNVTLLRPIVRISRQDRWLPKRLDNIDAKIAASLR